MAAVSAIAVVVAVVYLAVKAHEYYHVLRRRSIEKRELQERCAHQWSPVAYVWGAYAYPYRTCSLCGLQQHLEAPVPCPHCGEDLNRRPGEDWPVKIEVP